MADIETMKTIPFGAAVKTLREEHGWTQNILGQAIGLDQAVVSRLERGERMLDSDELERLVVIFPVLKEILPPPANVFNISASGPGFSFEIKVSSKEAAVKKLKVITALIEDS